LYVDERGGYGRRDRSRSSRSSDSYNRRKKHKKRYRSPSSDRDRSYDRDRKSRYTLTEEREIIQGTETKRGRKNTEREAIHDDMCLAVSSYQVYPQTKHLTSFYEFGDLLVDFI